MRQSQTVTILVSITLAVVVLNLLFTMNIMGQIKGMGMANEGGTQVVPTPTQQAAPTPTQPSEPSEPTRVEVSEDDDPFKGDADAPVTIIEFSDFECPFCGRFYSQTLPALEEKYIKTGKAKLVFRDFPLSFHPNAQKASEAAECANDQDKFWEMHDIIFENQGALTNADLKKYAADIGLDTATFDSCLDSGEKAAEVQADFAAGQAAGVSGTPSFFVNGVKLVGAQPTNVFEQIIEAELS